MATTSIARRVGVDEHICQGDVFYDVQYTYLDSEDNESVDLIEYTFPMAIIISQACDVDAMSKMIKDSSGNGTKFMPSLLMCPIYDKEEARNLSHLETALKELSISEGQSDHLFNSKEYTVVQQDWHYRFHALTVVDDKGNLMLDNAVIDFKHYFTVPPAYLFKNREKRLFHLDSLFAEQITLKFATFLSRVAIPN